MPPHRTFPPVKPIKTERTHEENQERAYIAASRRSDRSLEARVESARRASEIHKRRTGRSLRVTEQDVVNEEMYEEEDDDLPLQYRRLTAHLQTGSADFNRRLAAYLTNHVAMRSALDQAITNSYAQQYPNAPQFAHNQSVFPSPLSANDFAQTPRQQVQSPTQVHSPHSYRQSPYPTAGTPAYKQSPHDRSTSTQETPTFNPNFSHASSPGNDSLYNRRMSMPASAAAHQLAVRPRSGLTDLMPKPSNQVIKQEPDATTSMLPPAGQQPLQPSMMHSTIAEHVDFSPLTTALPQESQMFLGSALNPNDPFTQQLMGGNAFGQHFDFSNTFMPQKPSQYGPGMHETLVAPGSFRMSPSQSFTGANGADPSPYGQSLDKGSADFSGAAFNNSMSAACSGHNTPGFEEWESFINDASWGENAA